MKNYGGYTYILTNKTNRVFYIGVTDNLIRRVDQHKKKMTQGFTTRYNVNKLVWYEFHERIENAILKEKQLKNWKRAWKIELITKENPHFIDLYSLLLVSS